MPFCGGYQFLLVTYCDLSGEVEARPSRTLTSKEVAWFLWEDVICRHSCFGKLVIDRCLENKEVVEEWERGYGMKQVLVSAYNPETNGIIEHGHKPIMDLFSTISAKGRENWVRNLPAVLWADRSTLRTSTSLTPYYLNCGSVPLLLIKLEVATWKIWPWNQIIYTADLLAMWACQP